MALILEDLPREGLELGEARVGRVGAGAERSGAHAQGRELRGRVDLGGGGGHESDESGSGSAVKSGEVGESGKWIGLAGVGRHESGKWFQAALRRGWRFAKWA